jgi:hypothetical protein
MPVAFFQVRLSVQPKAGGEAELIPPQALHGLNYQFIHVKDGGQEGIVKLEGLDPVLKQVEKDKDCKKLTAKQLETLRASYPKPKIKQKYRLQPQVQESGETAPAGVLFAVDQTGDRIVEIFQTVRAGFYLIDVPVSAQSTGT